MDKTLLKFKIEAAKRKAAEAGRKALEVGRSGLEYVEEHKEVAVPLVMGGIAVAKKGAAAYAVNKEKKELQMRRYDPRKGRYVYMKRIPTKTEDAEMERRYENGESYRSIINDMNLAR